MDESSATQGPVMDINDSTVIQWGDSDDDVRYVGTVIERVVQAGDRASLAGDYARDHAEFIADLRGAATLLGLAIPGDRDIVAPLRTYLLASRDHEGETSESIIRAANGKSEDERRAARIQAMQHSGRRGVLDSAVYMLDRGVNGLETIRAWEAAEAAKKPAR